MNATAEAPATTIDAPARPVALPARRDPQPLPPVEVGSLHGPGNLAAALDKARARCKAAAKASENTFHKYKYASAEAIIDEAKHALADSGLALIPLTQRLRTLGSGTHELERQLVLTHSSGEAVPVGITWPVIPDRGRPLDKAFASALTTSLAYYLRDLLLMPRVDPDDDLAGREDRDEDAHPTLPPAPARENPPPRSNGAAPPDSRPVGEQARLPAKEPSLPRDGKDLVERMGKFEASLVEKGLCGPGELFAHLRALAPEEWDGVPEFVDDWSGDLIPWAVETAKEFRDQRRAARGNERDGIK